jgi:hypothetical protein
MSEQMLPAFARKSADAEAFRNLWEMVDGAVYQRLSAQYTSQPGNQVLQDALIQLDGKRHDMRQQFAAAFEKLMDSLWHPTLTFATTGTTSSGKSALVNMLCGATVMPVSHDEMSAGVVCIEHGEARKLTVHPTQGATWEPGTWEGLDDRQIQDRLEQVMRAYNSQRHGEAPPACPRCDLVYPTRLGRHPELLDLPPCCRIRILDLPGMKYIGDEANATIIREESRRAVCFIAYNSEEPEERKQQALLEQVVDQVKQLGGSPARMLFVLNRIDALRRDVKEGEDWKEREDSFVQKISDSIRQTLAARLQEFQEETRQLHILRLSTLPALLALFLLEEGHPARDDSAKKIDGTYGDLIPADVRDELKRDVRKWTVPQFREVGGGVWRSSYGEAFFATLREHIRKHFPNLIIPPATDRFKMEAAAQTVEWIIHTVEAELHSTKEEYEAETERLHVIRQKLRELCERGAEQLQAPFRQIEQAIQESEEVRSSDARQIADRLIARMRDTVKGLDHLPLFRSLYERTGRGSTTSPADSLYPLHGWLDEVNRTNSRIFEAVCSILENRQDDSVDSLVPRAVNALHAACRKLEQAGYTRDLAGNGGRIDTRDERMKQNLRTMNVALNALADVLPEVLSTAMDRALQTETRRVYAAVQQLVDLYWRHVTAQARDHAPDIGLTVPDASVRQIDTTLKLTYKFRAGFDIHTREVEEFARIEKEKVGERRLWYTLAGQGTDLHGQGHFRETVL